MISYCLMKKKQKKRSIYQLGNVAVVVSSSIVALSCLTLCDPRISLSGCSVHGILQAGILEWVAIPFSRGSSLRRDQTRDSRIAGIFFTF